jgi:PLP dependent protein
MTDDDIRQELTHRILDIENRIQNACNSANRKRSDVNLVAVSKTVSVRIAQIAFEIGLRNFGENRPQELTKKAAALPLATWHMIGHLQRNKVPETLSACSLIHSVDSMRLLEAIAKEGQKQNHIPKVLLQINASREDQKHGFDYREIEDQKSAIQALPVEVMGLMGMAAFADDPELARPAFRELRQFRDTFRATWPGLDHLSMGMSGDYEVAIEEGATFIRIGSTLFAGLE